LHHTGIEIHWGTYKKNNPLKGLIVSVNHNIIYIRAPWIMLVVKGYWPLNGIATYATGTASLLFIKCLK